MTPNELPYICTYTINVFIVKGKKYINVFLVPHFLLIFVLTIIQVLSDYLKTHKNSNVLRIQYNNHEATQVNRHKPHLIRRLRFVFGLGLGTHLHIWSCSREVVLEDQFLPPQDASAAR